MILIWLLLILILNASKSTAFLSPHFSIRSSFKLSRQNCGECPNIQNPNEEWGQSFIGQDVCGSKYNDDPFEQQDNKPDAWKEMAKKIDELYMAKLAQENSDEKFKKKDGEKNSHDLDAAATSNLS